jgi:hypothetical protein
MRWWRSLRRRALWRRRPLRGRRALPVRRGLPLRMWRRRARLWRLRLHVLGLHGTLLVNPWGRLGVGLLAGIPLALDRHARG